MDIKNIEGNASIDTGEFLKKLANTVGAALKVKIDDEVADGVSKGIQDGVKHAERQSKDVSDKIDITADGVSEQTSEVVSDSIEKGIKKSGSKKKTTIDVSENVVIKDEQLEREIKTEEKKLNNLVDKLFDSAGNRRTKGDGLARLSTSQTQGFAKSFGKLEKLLEYAGRSVSDKYKNISDNILKYTNDPDSGYKTYFKSGVDSAKSFIETIKVVQNNVDEATKAFNDFTEEVFKYQHSDNMHPLIPMDGGKAQKGAYNQVRSDLSKMADEVLTLQTAYNKFDTTRPVRELEKLEEELRDAEIKFAGTYSAANVYWNESLDKAKGGASKKVQDLYGYIMSGSGFFDNDAWSRNTATLEKKATDISEHISQIFQSIGIVNEISSKNLFSWIEENGTSAEKEIFKINEGLEEFRKVLRGLSSNSTGFDFSETLGLDVVYFDKDIFGKKTDEINNFTNSVSKAYAEWGQEVDKFSSKYDKLQDKIKELYPLRTKLLYDNNMYDIYSRSADIEDENIYKEQVNKFAKSLPKSKVQIKKYIEDIVEQGNEASKKLLSQMALRFGNYNGEGENPAYSSIGQRVFSELTSKTSKEKMLAFSQVIDEHVRDWKNEADNLGKVKSTIEGILKELSKELKLDIDDTDIHYSANRLLNEIPIKDIRKGNTSVLKELFEHNNVVDQNLFNALDISDIDSVDKLDTKIDELTTSYNELSKAKKDALNEDYDYEKYKCISDELKEVVTALNAYKLLRKRADKFEIEERKGRSSDALREYIEDLEKTEVKSKETKQAIKEAIKISAENDKAGSAFETLVEIQDMIITKAEEAKKRLYEETAALDAMEKLWIKAEGGVGAEESNRIVAALNEFQTKRINIGQDEEGNMVYRTSWDINYDKLKDRILKKDAEIIKLEHEIANATEGTAEGAKENLEILKQERSAYEKILDAAIESPDYKVDEKQRELLLGLRAIEEQKLRNNLRDQDALKISRQLDKEQVKNNAKVQRDQVKTDNENIKKRNVLYQTLIDNLEEIGRLEQENEKYSSGIKKDTSGQQVVNEENITRLRRENAEIASKIVQQDAEDVQEEQKVLDIIEKINRESEQSTYQTKSSILNQIKTNANTLEQMSKGNVNKDFVQQLTSAVVEMRKFANETDVSKVGLDVLISKSREFAKTTQNFKDLKGDNIFNIDSLYNKLSSKINKALLKNINEEGRAELTRLQSQLDDFHTNKAEAEMKSFAAVIDSTLAPDRFNKWKFAGENAVAQVRREIEEFRFTNSNLSEDKKSILDDLAGSLNANTTVDQLIKTKTILADIKSEAAALGQVGKNFFDTVKQRLIGVNAQLIAQYLSFQDLIRYARTGFETIRELDYALVDLAKTTKMSQSEMNNFYLSANNVAKQMGVTTKEIIDQAAQWSRLNKIGLLYGNV